ncbi:hypothetical protein FOZ60_012578 [Perkinsus olseni]|uniref:Uncharacterized protein n=1 Tax=Perkinsus olseni TaxID=32597 RepID=A0A7J6NB52_PEROL|nr:hypothetical protein FOZ60_012578 [Perkinsus olseni]
MPQGSFNLGVDLLAIHTKFQGIRHVPHSCLKATLEFMGQRQPVHLRRHDHARCRECCRGSWWHEHVNCRREAALDTVLHISYELSDSWQVVENKNGKFKQTGVSLADLPGEPSNEVECRGGRIYGAVENERIIVYSSSTGKWSTQAMTKDAPSSFDVCPLGPHDCRIAYSDNFKPWQVSIIYEDGNERKLADFTNNKHVAFVTPDVILADDTHGDSTVCLSLLDIRVGATAEPLAQVNFVINPGDCLQGVEVSPCGHVVYVETLATSRLITGIY